MCAYEKADSKSPSLFGVAFFALLIALVGALSGFTLLASLSPEPFSSVADYKSDLEKNPEQDISSSHYFRGYSVGDRKWVSKRRTLLIAEDATVELKDSEINAWIIDKFKKPEVSFSERDRPKLYIVPGLPNCFIDSAEGVHFNMLLEIVVFGKQIDCLLIGKGHFAEEDPVEFHLSRLRLNGALIPFPEKLHGPLLGSLLKPLYESDEFVSLKEAWKKVDSVELVENGIRLHLD